MSGSASGRRGGTPSTTTPIAGPWLSPQVVKRNSVPNELPAMSRGPRHSRASGIPGRPPFPLDPRLRACNPNAKSSAIMLFLVVPAKAGTQGFEPLAAGSPHARGRRVCPSGGYSDILLREGDEIILVHRIVRILNHTTE